MTPNSPAILERVLRDLDREAFKVDDLDHLPVAVSEAIVRVAGRLDSDAPSPELHQIVTQYQAEGVFSAPRAWSVRAMIDLHPARADHAAAARAIGEMRLALLQEVDPVEQARGHEAVERLWGALCFLEGNFVQALEHYARALEIRPAVTNMANVLAVLIRLGWTGEAHAVRADLTRSCPAQLVDQLDERIMRDPDLAPLRLPAPSLAEVA